MEVAEIYLTWYRDRGQGQQAAETYGAECYNDGSWPVAKLPCRTADEAELKWRGLLGMFGVNAHTWFVLR